MELDHGRLAAHRTIDLTTFGRRSGASRRIEIWWFHVDGRFVITGTPGRRDWLANIHANPRVVIHVDGMDITARAIPVEDVEFRRHVFTRPHVSWYTTQAELDRLVGHSPMVEIQFDH
ncbi:MAG: nitroreductase/quinone reductase family protein [Acidimicrobiia bacterium]|jgi:deazaflavin-dependent oxidoreductase (nitroreductase family)